MTNKAGMVVIHEVAALPRGEAGYVMWDATDLVEVITGASPSVEWTAAETLTRPCGWPLQTICFVSRKTVPTAKELQASAIQSLPNSIARWVERLRRIHTTGDQYVDGRVRGFLMAQVAGLCLWCSQYLGDLPIRGSQAT